MDKARSFAESVEKYVEKRVELMRFLLASKGEEAMRLELDRMASKEDFRMQMMAAYGIAWGDGYRAAEDELRSEPSQGPDEP